MVFLFQQLFAKHSYSSKAYDNHSQQTLRHDKVVISIKEVMANLYLYTTSLALICKDDFQFQGEDEVPLEE